MDVKYCVYKHTTPANKVYIGITCQNPLRRWSNGKGYINNAHFANAIRKYGWENIQHEILYDGLSRECACDIEKTLIAQYKSIDPKHGYNNTSGGDCNFIFSNETIDRLSKATIEKWNNKEWRDNQLSKRRSEEFRKKQSVKTKDNWKNTKIREKMVNSIRANWDIPEFREAQYKIMRSPERLKKIAELSRKKWENPNYRNKMQLVSKQRWRKESEHIKASQQMKERWANKEYKDNHSGEKSPFAKPIFQFDKDGNLINRFATVMDAERSLNIYRASCHISQCANGKRKTAYGYLWRYEELNAEVI